MDELTTPSLLSVRIAFLSVLPLYVICGGGGGGDKPLLLTPYLDNGDISTARKLSHVKGEGIFPNITLPRSYAGFFTVNKTVGNHMFFWHFPSPTMRDAPLLLWLNGGPTLSSMLGLLWENGPVLGIDPSRADVRANPYTWVGNFSMLYVDNPVGAGYSFSDSGTEGHRFLQADYGRELYSFMEQFFRMFPEYLKRDFYIGGQSYAGKYVPTLAHLIHEHRLRKLTDMPLTGIYLGGPYFDPPTESLAFPEYLYALGAFSHASMMDGKESVRQITESFRQGKVKSMPTTEIMNEVFPDSGLGSNDNYVTEEGLGLPFVELVMRSREVRSAVHAGSGQYYTLLNVALYNRFGAELLETTSLKMATLMDNYKVLVYTGDYDVVVSSVMVESALLVLPWSLQAQYNATGRSLWRGEGAGSKPGGGGALKGYYSRTGRFCRVVVHGAGHQTPRDQPETSLEMMIHFTRYGCIRSDRKLDKP